MVRIQLALVVSVDDQELRLTVCCDLVCLDDLLAFLVGRAKVATITLDQKEVELFDQTAH